MKFQITKKFILILLCFPLYLNAQQSNIKVEQYQLKNGLTVFLNPDPNASKIFGAVAVNAGGKNDPADATGIAHYLEHLLFKGTTEMGTLNYEAEKPHLEAINKLYDQLAKTNATKERASIQKKINEHAVAAAKYSLPNEFDNLLKGIGSTGVNAFTSSDMTFYHNSFPPNQILKWLEIYSHRFQEPVFRSFQSELEVVYEEKNRSMDDFQRGVFEKFNAEVFGEHPYGTQTVLGSIEHLKRPSLTKMYEFFKTYYVANNMALILCGNFDAEKIKPLIKEKFGVWKTGKVPNFPNYTLNKFNGKKEIKTRLTPVKAGVLGYKTVGNNHPDKVALDVLDYMIFNGSETGLLNQLQLNNKLTYAGAFPSSYNDDGASVLFFVPKIIGQSMGKAEKLVLAELEKIKTGAFDDDLLAGVKNEVYKNFQTGLENLRNRGTAIGYAFNRGISWEKYMQYPQEVNAINKATLIQIANKYFGDDYLALYSRMGFPKKPKLSKPNYKAVKAEQTASSSFAKNLTKVATVNQPARFLDFDKSMQTISLKGGNKLYNTNNPLNDIYNLQLIYHVGRIEIPDLNTAASMMNYAGAGQWNLAQLKTAFAKTGTGYSINATRDKLTINLKGIEANLADALAVLSKLLNEPKANKKSIDLIVNDERTNRRLEKRSPSQMGNILRTYITFGEESSYKNRKSIAEIKKLSPNILSQKFKRALGYNCSIHYTGNKSPETLKELIEKFIPLSNDGKKVAATFPQLTQSKQNQIYFINDKKAVQSQVYFYVRGNAYSRDQYIPQNGFNTYFGDGFSGLVLQEIREYRSLAYSTWGRYYVDERTPKKVGWLWSFIGCQGDKTTDAIAVMVDLIKDLPQKPSRIDNIRSNLQLKAQSAYPSFRTVSQSIERLKDFAYEDDPNRSAVAAYEKMSFEEIVEFYQNNIKGKPITIAIYGDKKRVNLEKLKAFGEVIELKRKDVMVK